MEDVPWSQRRNHGLYLSWAPHKRHKETLGSHVDAVEINITSRRNEVSSVLPFYTLKCSTTQFYMTQFWAQEALDKKAPKPPTVLTTLSCQTPNPRGCQSRVLLLNCLIDFTNSSIGDYKQTQYKQGLDTSWDNHDTCSLQNNEMLLHYTRALNPTRIPASWDDAIRNEVITEAHHSLSFCFSAWLTVRVIQSQGRNNPSETLFKHTGGNLFSVQEALPLVQTLSQMSWPFLLSAWGSPLILAAHPSDPTTLAHCCPLHFSICLSLCDNRDI